MRLIATRKESGKRSEIMDTSVTVLKSDRHSCCKKTQQARTIRSYLAGIVAAFLACLCCSLPLIPLMLGISAGSSLLSLTKHHLLFDTFGVLILLGSLIYIWREHKSEEKSAFKNRKFWTCLIVTFAMYAAMNVFLKQVVGHELAVRTGQTNIHVHH